MCLLCCGSVLCVVCELYGVQLRPAVGVLVVPYSESVNKYIYLIDRQNNAVRISYCTNN